MCGKITTKGVLMLVLTCISLKFKLFSLIFKLLSSLEDQRSEGGLARHRDYTLCV